MGGILSLSNLKKTWYYMKKNGLRDAYLAAWERLLQKKEPPYFYEAPSGQELKAQRAAAVKAGANEKAGRPPFFSIVVPAYETKEEYLIQLLDSVNAQTYPYWELVIADAGKSGRVKETLRAWAGGRGLPVSWETEGQMETPGRTEAAGQADTVPQPEAGGRFRHLKLSGNRGISANTNAGIAAARGDYIGLLDHDDMLAPDALYETASAVLKGKKDGAQPKVVYSDEDKCDGGGTFFYEPHRKMDFNLDLLLSNNYICHFLVMEKKLLNTLLLREAFDGAQDYDLVLRAAERGAVFSHVPKVLYHWRCHAESTAENPNSKMYAYEAGRRAVEDFCKRKGWRVTVSHLKHLGFYRVNYEGRLFEIRRDVGVLAGPFDNCRRAVLRGGKQPGLSSGRKARGLLYSGIYDADNKMLYAGLRRGFSGPVHRAALMQDAVTADLRCMLVRPELEALYGAAVRRLERRLGQFEGGRDNEDAGAVILEAGRQFCSDVRSAGYLILWDPQFSPPTLYREKQI